MVYTTRSGKQYRHQITITQCSCWCNASILHVVAMVLPACLDLASLLQARLVCRAWRAVFSNSATQLQLLQPMSAGTARTLARKAAAAFPCTTTLRIMLYMDQQAELRVDLTTDASAPVCVKLDRPEAAIALLRQFEKAVGLQELQLQLQNVGRFSGLHKMLLLVPQLVVLDLSGCQHESSDLLVVAQHLHQLQGLLLHCQEYCTLAGCRKSSGSSTWARMGGNTCYEPAHVAALVQLPQLRLLECPVPTGGWALQVGGDDGAELWAVEWLQSIAQLTQLTALHLIQGHGAWARYPLPAAAVTCLSTLTGLQHLRTDTGGGGFCRSHCADVGVKQAEVWAVVLRGMQQLTRLEMTRALVGDPLLRAVGAAGMPRLQVLVLETLDMLREVTTTADGANALAHIPRIELLYYKGLVCKQHMPLLELPNMKRVVNCKQWSGERRELQRWTQEDCACAECGMNRIFARSSHCHNRHDP